jgi:hypothetical protein
MVIIHFSKKNYNHLNACEPWWFNFVDYYSDIIEPWYGFDSINQILKEYDAMVDPIDKTVIFNDDAKATWFLLKWA